MKTILLFTVTLVVVLGCKKNNNTNNTNTIASDIFPNKVGDMWIYLVNDTTVNRNSLDSPAVQYNLTVSIIDSIELPGGIKANVWVYASPGRKDTNYVFQKDDTLRFIDINQTVSSMYAKQYVIPLSLHNTWQYSVPSINNATVDSQSDIIVGENHYDNAFRIYGLSGMPDAGFVISEWVENNIGVVKRYFNPRDMLIDPRHVIAWSLVSYYLK